MHIPSRIPIDFSNPFQSIVIKQNKDFTHERYLELYFFFYFINLIVENSLFYFNIYRYSVKKKKKEQHNCDFRCLEKSTRYISMFYLVVRICCLKELCNHISMLRKTQKHSVFKQYEKSDILLYGKYLSSFFKWLKSQT